MQVIVIANLAPITGKTMLATNFAVMAACDANVYGHYAVIFDLDPGPTQAPQDPCHKAIQWYRNRHISDGPLACSTALDRLNKQIQVLRDTRMIDTLIVDTPSGNPRVMEMSLGYADHIVVPVLRPVLGHGKTDIDGTAQTFSYVTVHCPRVPITVVQNRTPSRLATISTTEDTSWPWGDHKPSASILECEGLKMAYYQGRGIEELVKDTQYNTPNGQGQNHKAKWDLYNLWSSVRWARGMPPGNAFSSQRLSSPMK